MKRNVLALLILSALALVGVVVLLALGRTVPEYLTLIPISGLSALAGVALPTDGALPPDAAAVLGAIGGKLDTLIGHLFSAKPAPVAASSAPAAAATGGSADAGSPLPPATPATDAPTTVASS